MYSLCTCALKPNRVWTHAVSAATTQPVHRQRALQFRALRRPPPTVFYTLVACNLACSCKHLITVLNDITALMISY
jgi:hypothetical protein